MPEHPNASPHRVIAIASSAGGLQALTIVLSALPADLAAAVVIVQHLSPDHPSHMADILDRRSPMRVKEAQHAESINDGTAYIAPPDNHLLLSEDGCLSLSKAALVSFSRPSADLLFDSVAGAYGNRAIAVVLTGSGSDGAAGIAAVYTAGGHTIAQSEDTAEHASMPHAAIATGKVKEVVPLHAISGRLCQLVTVNR